MNKRQKATQRLEASPYPYSLKTLPHHHYAAHMDKDLALLRVTHSKRLKQAMTRFIKRAQDSLEGSQVWFFQECRQKVDADEEESVEGEFRV
jgi:hypothetical protein